MISCRIILKNSQSHFLCLQDQGSILQGKRKHFPAIPLTTPVHINDDETKTQDPLLFVGKSHDQMSDDTGLIKRRHRIEPVCVCKFCVMRVDICSADGVSIISVSAPLSEGIFIFYPGCYYICIAVLIWS